VVESIIKRGGGIKNPFMNMVEGSEEFQLSFESQGAPEVSGKRRRRNGVGVKPLEGLSPRMGISMPVGGMKEIGVSLCARRGMCASGVSFERSR
jgi:hypothetical protein